MPGGDHSPFDVVVVAASFGGLETIMTVLAGLPATFPVPVVVVLHRRPHTEDRTAGVLDRHCALPVRPVRDRDLLRPGEVLVAPAQGARMDAPGRLTVPAPEASRRRCADTLFAGAAVHHGRKVISVVLTGRLDDGARGVAAVKSRGGRALVQDPDTAAAPGMPQAALATGCVDFVLVPAMLTSALVALTMARGAEQLLRVPPPPWAALHSPLASPATIGSTPG
jgi:two-component system chemotaxis response regulator CheB